jgi:hypothetical protein
VLDGLLPGLPVLLACVCWLDGVMVETMVTTAGVSPGLVGVWVMRMSDVRISVADGGAEGAVTTDVTTGAGVDAGGGAAAADDCAGGALDCAGGGAEDAGGGAEDGAGAGVLTGAADEGAGACEEGASAEDGGLDCAGAGDDGAGAAEESAARVTDGEGGDEAEAAGGGADC